MAVSRAGFGTLVVVVLLIGFAVGFLIGYFINPENKDKTLQNLRAELDEDLVDRIIEEVNEENIREDLRKWTEKPHMSGTPIDLQHAEELAAFWRKLNFDTVKIVPYDVLLSFPDKTIQNRITLYDRYFEPIHQSQIYEKPLRPEHNRSDVVQPFNAFAGSGSLRGDLVFVNYGRIEDFTWLSEEKGMDFRGKICIAKYGKIFRGDKARIAESFSAAGLILYSDPKDYTVEGEPVYPDGEYLPGTGVQRGSLNLDGDVLTPGYPATESAYRRPQEEAGLPNIPVHPIGYDDAKIFLQNMAGEAAPSDWQGRLPITYKLGPGFIDPSWKIEMIVSNLREVKKIYNVFGFIEGSVEPDRYVLVGNHRDAWVYGSIDPTSATVAMMEMSRVFKKLMDGGWRPRRTIVFCSWAGEEQGIIGSREWVENFDKILGARAVAYINVDSAVQGNFTLRGRASPLLFQALYDVAKKIPNPNPAEVAAGRTTVYDTWLMAMPEKDGNGRPTGKPRVPILGSGSDFTAFIGKVGVTCADLRYRFDPNLNMSSQALYHSAYETFHLLDSIIDRGFKIHKAVTQYWGVFTHYISDSYILPFDVMEFASTLNTFMTGVEVKYGQLIRANNLTEAIEFLDGAIQNFKSASWEFTKRLQNANRKNPMEIRMLNDQLMNLERSFINPEGLPGRPFVRNVIFAPSKYDAYSGTGFPGLKDTLFEIEKATGADRQARWEAVRKHMAELTYYIDTAAASLQNTTQF